MLMQQSFAVGQELEDGRSVEISFSKISESLFDVIGLAYRVS